MFYEIAQCMQRPKYEGTRLYYKKTMQMYPMYIFSEKL